MRNIPWGFIFRIKKIRTFEYDRQANNQKRQKKMAFLGEDIKRFLKNNYFSYGVYVCVLLGIIPLIFMHKYTINLWVNHTIANYTTDPFFIYYTNCFEGYIHALPIVVFAFISRRKCVLFLVQALLVLVFIFLLKEVVFGNIPRPTQLLGYKAFDHLLENSSVYKEGFSFPSGHTTTAFAVMSMFAYLSKSRLLQVFLFVLAIVAAFSRIYLQQHFFVDTYVGMIVGFTTTIIAVKLLDRFRVSEKPLLGGNNA